MTTNDTGGASPMEKVPPQDIRAEQAALGAALLSTDAAATVLATVKARDYYRPQHKVIHNAIAELYMSGEPIDKITLWNALIRRSETNLAGGPDYLNVLLDAIPTSANADYYADIVREHAATRRVIEAATRAAEHGYTGATALDVADRLQADLADAINPAADEDSGLIGDSLDAYEAELLALQRDGQAQGVPTGFTDLDSLTGGWQPGQFVIVAARPALGKSTLALDFARACSFKHERPSVFFSLEMSRTELMHRVFSAQGRIALHHLRHQGLMTDEDWPRYRAVKERAAKAPLTIDATANMTVQQIKAKCRRMKQQAGLDLVVVDYLQLLQSDRQGSENRQVEVSVMSRGLKLMAKELKVPVIVLAQLNRGPMQRTDKRPMVSDLRESGSLEQDADIVILIHREDAYEKESPRAGEADLIVAKHRNGPTATLTAAAQMHYSRFVDMAQS